MKSTMRSRGAAAAGGAFALLALAFASPASADAVADFYKGKTITIAVGVSPGGSYDMYSRLLARFIGKYIPGNPNLIVQNVKGGNSGHIMAAKFLEQSSDTDGTLIATFTAGILTDALMDPAMAIVDFKNFAFIGTISKDLRACYTWHTLGAKTWEEVKKKKTKYGTANKTSYSYQAAAVLKNMLGADMKIVMGYPGSAERRIAIEAGELDTYCGSWVSTPKDWVKEKKIEVFMRFSAPAPDMPEGVPYVGDIVKTPEEKQIIDLLFAASEIAPPFAVSARVPADRLKALRDAFDATMKDAEFLDTAKKENMPVNPADWKETQATIDRVIATPPKLVEKVKVILD